MRRWFLFTALIIALVPVGCLATPTAQPAPREQPTNTPVEKTETTGMEATEPPPTDTPTPEPTDTPAPTATSKPTETPEPTPPRGPSPTLSALGLDIKKPVPVGAPIITDNDLEVTILGVKRNAWPEIEEVSSMNEPPRQGYQSVLVQVRVENLGSPDETKGIRASHFDLTGSSGAVYERAMARAGTHVAFTVNVSRLLEGEIFGEGVLEGQLVFEIPEDERNLLLIYDPGMEASTYWLAVDEITPPVVPPIEPAASAREDRGLKRSDPVPLGEAALSDHGIEITVLGVERDAWNTIQGWSDYNDPPEEDREYILVEVQVRHVKGQKQVIDIERSDFQTVGEKGLIYEESVITTFGDTILRDVGLLLNGSIAGQLPLQASEGEQRLVLIYDPGFESSPRYLSLE